MMRAALLGLLTLWSGCSSWSELQDRRCPDGQNVCDGSCVALTSSEHCGACGNACGAQSSCVDGRCVSLCVGAACGEDCVDLQTNVSHCGQCDRSCAVNCGTADCSTWVCSDGECVAGANPGCPIGNQRCGENCVDGQTDEANCGGCGTLCLVGQICVAGDCQCAGASTLCTDGCVDTNTDENNCGSCSNSCATGETCRGGTCFCENGSNCGIGATCVNLQTDMSNCGSCGISCASTDTCQGGQCVEACIGAETFCSGAGCVDLMADEGNCGACGTVCGANTVCSNGECACSAPFNQCSSDCVSFQTDRAHCGDCTTACAEDQDCADGVCRPLDCPATCLPGANEPECAACPPRLMAPLSGRTFHSTGVVFRWTGRSNVVLERSRSADFSTSTTQLPATGSTLTNGVPVGGWFWRVRTRTSSGALGPPTAPWFVDVRDDGVRLAGRNRVDVNFDGVADVAAAEVGSGNVHYFLGGPLTRQVENFSRDVGAQWGSEIVAAGDLDGDGRGEFAAFAGFATTEPGVTVGVVTVLHPDSGGGAWQNSFVPFIAHDDFGTALAAGGDINGDGFGDLVIGAPGRGGIHEDPCPAGNVYVLFGSADLRTRQFDSVERIEVSSNPDTGGARMGSSVAGGIDLDGDGFDDFIAGGPTLGATTCGSWTANPAGAIWIFRRAASATTRLIERVQETGTRQLGRMVRAGFLNGARVLAADSATQVVDGQDRFRVFSYRYPSTVRVAATGLFTRAFSSLMIFDRDTLVGRRTSDFGQSASSLLQVSSPDALDPTKRESFGGWNWVANFVGNATGALSVSMVGNVDETGADDYAVVNVAGPDSSIRVVRNYQTTLPDASVETLATTGLFVVAR